MSTGFNDLGVIPEILSAITEMGFETPTEVQRLAIPHVMKKEDLIVMSKTGSGKTAAFGIPMLQMNDPSAPGPQALILTPTRELAVQVDSDIRQMAKQLQFKTTAVYGQHSMNVEIQALEKGVSIVTGTPGRVQDHIRQGNLATKHIRFLVLDEADRMLDMGFIDQVVRIIRTLPKDRVTMLFSATMPVEVRRICREYMKQPVTIEIESETMTVDTIQQAYYRVEKNDKRTQLDRLLTVEQPDSCMIFCNTRAAVDRVQEYLSRKGYASQALHGEIPQGRRLKTIQQFKTGDFHMLVATDVAARGLHVEDLSLVINYDVPNEKDSYVHRIGRTGRAGNGGRAVTLVTSEDIISLYEIEEHIGVMIPEEELPTDAMVQQSRSQAAEKWAKARMHHRPERHSSEAKAEGKPKPAKAPGNQGQKRAPSGGAPKDKRTAGSSEQDQRTNPGEKANGNPPRDNKRPPHPREGSRPPHSHDKPRPPRVSRDTDPAHVRAEKPQPQPPVVPAAAKSPETAESPSVFKRMFQRIFGKK